MTTFLFMVVSAIIIGILLYANVVRAIFRDKAQKIQDLQDRIEVLEKFKENNFTKETTQKWIVCYNVANYTRYVSCSHTLDTLKEAEQYENACRKGGQVVKSVCKRELVKYVPKWVLEDK